MLQSVPSSQFLGRAVPVSFADTTNSGDPLLSFAGRITGSHALVIAPNGLDLMCRLLRGGCAAATTRRLSKRANHETYDFVLAPSVVSSAAVGTLIHQVKRALVPSGRFLAFVPTELSEQGQNIVVTLMHAIRMSGFVGIQTRTAEDGLLLRADLPAAALANALPILLSANI